MGQPVYTYAAKNRNCYSAYCSDGFVHPPALSLSIKIAKNGLDCIADSRFASDCICKDGTYFI
jgi:hypothetical protein